MGCWFACLGGDDSPPFGAPGDQDVNRLILLCLLRMKRRQPTRTVVPSTCHELDGLAQTDPRQAGSPSHGLRKVHCFHWIETFQPTPPYNSTSIPCMPRCAASLILVRRCRTPSMSCWASSIASFSMACRSPRISARHWQPASRLDVPLLALLMIHACREYGRRPSATGFWVRFARPLSY